MAKEKEEYGGGGGRERGGGRGGGGKIGGEERCEELPVHCEKTWSMDEERTVSQRERQRSTWLIHDKCLSERRITLGPSDNDHQDDDNSRDGDDSDGGDDDRRQ